MTEIDWRNKYIINPTPWEVMNCYELFRAVQAILGIDVPVIEFDGDLDIRKQFRDHPESKLWERVDNPKPGDAVFMAKRGRWDHIGVWTGEKILHTFKGGSACAYSEFMINRAGWTRVEYYARRTKR